MNEAYAINLTNFVATPQGVGVREGYRNYATGITGYVETLMPYVGVGNFPNKLFAAAGSRIYDATNPGAATQLLTGLLSAQWSHTGFSIPGGNYLVICNGQDSPRHWNGSAWVTWAQVTTPSAPGQISGYDPVKFESVITHQRRLWFVEKNTTTAWYLPVNSMGGAAVSFNFGPHFSRGGRLVALASWSMTGGTGMQNMLAAVSSTGDLVIYEGTDPADSTKWSIKGSWRLGAPVGNRCFLQFGGETLYLSQDGLMPLSKYMQTTTTESALTDTIRDTISRLTSSQQGLPGFQVHDYLARNLLILNVPQINPDQNFQFIYNTITGGWSAFTGWPAQCWATLGSMVFFGANGKVCQAFNGYKDNANFDGSGGDVYTATAQQAFSYFDKPGMKKRFVRAKVNLVTASGAPNVRLDCNTDFNLSAPASIGSATPSSAAVWGQAIWGVAEWSGGLQNYNAWQTLGAIGYAGSIVLAVAVQAETLWVSTEWEIEPGGSR